MGLNGRKPKQRIGNDPRNLSWSDDAARFGINYLAKFGWDSSKGLGASGEGRKSHLEVSKKLDMLGIGAAHQHDPNGIAWKQNKDFENLLKRLNGDVMEGSAVEGFNKADSGEIEGVGDSQEKNHVRDEEKKEKKRKRDDSRGGDVRNEKKKKAENHEEEKEKEVPRASGPINFPSEREATTSERRRTVPTLPRHRAHRARAIAAKNLSSKSAAHISEILGVAPTTTATSPGLTSGIPQDVGSILEIDRITTSTKSVHDYFKEKLKTKKPSTFVNPPVSALDHSERDLSRDTPRGGLGSSTRTAFGSLTPSSTFLAAATQALPSDATEVEVDEESAATRDRDDQVKRKKKRNKVIVEQKTTDSEALVSDNDTRRKAKEGKMVDVAEYTKSPVGKITAAGEDMLANVTTKKKKGGKRKKRENILEIREVVDYTI